MSKKRKLAHQPGKPALKARKPTNHNKPASSSTSSRSHKLATIRGRPSASTPGSSATSSSTSAPPPPPVIPFDPEEDAILLVGDGDLSFAASLVDYHGCQDVTATVLEPDAAALALKYPDTAAIHAATVEAAGGRVVYGVDARTMRVWGRGGGGRKKKGGSKDSKDAIEGGGSINRIIFNFPHVGGKSTDVNRQVRHHQELLVAFFQRALLSLAPGGSIIVTLFEGEPYSLWNIRDLARHAGLQVERSFRFSFAAYPGYHHVRTLGIVRKKKRKRRAGGEGKEEGEGEGEGDGAKEKEDDADEREDEKDSHDDDDEEKDEKDENDDHDEKDPSDSEPEVATSAWRGEDRLARSYVFVRKGDTSASASASSASKSQSKSQSRPSRKRSNRDDSDSSDDE